MPESAVTVVIPAFNAQATLSRAVDSVMAQVLVPRKVVIVNDGSRDNTRAIADALSAESEMVEVAHLDENGGAGRARQVGLERSETEFVAFIDADDEWHPEHLSVSVAVLENSRSAAAAFSSGARIEDATEQWSDLRSDRIRIADVDAVMVQSPVVQSSVVARREAVLSAGGYRPGKRFAEDFDLWLRLAAKSELVWLSGAHVRVYRTPGQVSQARDDMTAGMWEAIAYFERWAEVHWDAWDPKRFARLVDTTLDISVQNAKCEWDSAAIDAVFRGARSLKYQSPRLAYWERWRRTVWPLLSVGHRIDMALPLPLRNTVRGMLRLSLV